MFSGEVLELDLSTVVSCMAGPKRPHDKVTVADMKNDFLSCLTAPVGFKGFGVPDPNHSITSTYKDQGEFVLRHGSVVIAAITSCTNTSNPDVMLSAGLLAKNAIEKGLTV